MKINLRPEILQDEMIKIIPLKETDFEELFKVASDPLIWEQHPTRDRYKPEVFKLYFDGAILGQSAFKIIDILRNEIIGSSRFYDYKPEKKSIAIGYSFLAKEYWGGIYNKSAKRLLIDYAFKYVDNIYFHIGSTNIRSQKAITKIGATKVGEVDFDYYGRKLLHFEYAISKKEWIESSSTNR
ncbi:MAG: GNAT family N-acetyltransferase [Bacteroidia bacterium]